MREKPVRLKIAVGPKLSGQIKRFSERLDRSQSWVAAQLLAVMVNENKRFLSWFAWRLTAGAVQTVKELANLVQPFHGQPEPMEKPTGYLQVYVTEDLVQEIHRYAEAMGLSDAEAAGRMMYCSMEVQGWAIEMVTTRLVVAVVDLVDIEPAANEPGNLEFNLNHEKVKARKASRLVREAAVSATRAVA